MQRHLEQVLGAQELRPRPRQRRRAACLTRPLFQILGRLEAVQAQELRLQVQAQVGSWVVLELALALALALVLDSHKCLDSVAWVEWGRWVACLVWAAWEAWT